MTKLIILILAFAATFFIVKNSSNNKAIEQLQLLNKNLERLYYQPGLDMRFPERENQKFSA